MLKIVLAAAAMLAAAGSAHAINRYNSTTMTCQKAQTLVSQQKAVIFRYPSARKPSLTLYDRFVKHGGLCNFGEFAAPIGIPTKNVKSCPMLRCISKPDDSSFRHRRGGGNLGNFGVLIK